jgi:hypothetical protein
MSFLETTKRAFGGDEEAMMRRTITNVAIVAGVGVTVFEVGMMVLAIGIGGELYDQLAASGGLTLATVGAVLIAAGAFGAASQAKVFRPCNETPLARSGRGPLADS